MAPLPPVPNCFELLWIYTDGADTNMQNHTYWSFNGSLSAQDLQTICVNAVTQWTNHIAPLYGTHVTLEEVFGNDLSSKTGAQAASTTTSSGTVTGTTQPTSGACFVLSFEGGLKYRGGHSRIYMPALPASDLADPNTWNTTSATNMVNGWTALRNALIASIPTAVGVVAQVIAHRFGASATAPVGVSGAPSSRSVPLTNPFTTPVTATRGNFSVGSQRRRNAYIG